jgi:CRP/FNR family transcriptional regulator, anaerobic regulatory protein
MAPTLPQPTVRRVDIDQVSSTTAIDVHQLRNACSLCTLHELCLPVGLSAEELAELDHIVKAHHRMRKGERIYSAGDPFHALYAVRVGSFKTSLTVQDGREQVTGFFMLGDILGLDGVGTDQHSCEAVALEDGEVCIMPFSQFDEIAQRVRSLQCHVQRLLSREIVRDQHAMLVLGSMRAEERLAGFLLNLADRYKARGYSSSEFVLRMTREEIGSYLGLKLETVSRLFSRFQEAGLLRAQQRQIKIVDPIGLKQLIGQDA